MRKIFRLFIFSGMLSATNCTYQTPVDSRGKINHIPKGIWVNCKAATIADAATLSGHLVLSWLWDMGDGVDERTATGRIKIFIGPPKSPDLNEEVDMKGMFVSKRTPSDILTYADLGNDKYRHLFLHIDFKNRIKSYADFNGKRYWANCL